MTSGRTFPVFLTSTEIAWFRLRSDAGNGVPRNLDKIGKCSENSELDVACKGAIQIIRHTRGDGVKKSVKLPKLICL